MMLPAEVIIKLEQATGRKDKEAIILTAWQNGLLEFFQGAALCYNSLVTFGVKQIPLAVGSSSNTFGWTQFASLTTSLQLRKFTGNAARDAIQQACNECEPDTWNLWYRRVLMRDLKCGITETTINSVLSKLGPKAKAYTVPVFTCQLAKDSDDHPNDMRGKKLCDFKLDGARLLTVLNKATGEVIQYSRNGHINNNFPQLTEALATLLPQLTESIVLDGEVVSASFQAMMKQFKRKKNIDTSDAHLALFDIVPLGAFIKGEYMVSQRDRHLALCQLEPLLKSATNDQVSVVPKVEIDLDTEEGQARLSEFNREALDSGVEGIMVKDPGAPYKCKRSSNWLKTKPFIFVDLEVTAVVPGKPGTKYEHTMGAVEFSGEDQGRKISVSVGSGWSDEDRDMIWKYRKKALGRIGEIRADAISKSQNGDTWSLRFPRFERWRGWELGEKI